jgi:ubiquinone/menaquinone biosynthesis C-methylase UbiE
MIKKILRKTKRLANGIFGTRIDELYWKARHVFDKEWAESYISEGSINHPHRKLLIDKISEYAPFESILEIGCASGPNLYLLAKKFPGAKLYGIDISENAIRTGSKFFKKENIGNVFLSSEKAEGLKKFQDKSIDVIFTDAVLIYEGPEKIKSVIKEMLRVAKKAIVICEQHRDFSSSFYQDNWIHDYKALFGEFVPREKITSKKIPVEIWSGNWGKLGYIIGVIL